MELSDYFMHILELSHILFLFLAKHSLNIPLPIFCHTSLYIIDKFNPLKKANLQMLEQYSNLFENNELHGVHNLIEQKLQSILINSFKLFLL